MDLTNVLIFKYPGASFFLRGDKYEGLEWHDKKIAKPTLEDIEKANLEYESYKEKNKYKKLREAAYPSVIDQLDTLYNLGIDAWRDEIKAIKDKYPAKPGEVSNKPIDKMEQRMQSIERSIEQLAKGLTDAQSNSQDIKAIVSDVNAAMTAIKGFMMMMPEIQKSINEIKTIINK